MSLGRICYWKSAGRKNRNKAVMVTWKLSFKGLRMAQKGLGWGVRGSAHLVCKGQYHCLCVHECSDLLACRPCINAYLRVQECWDPVCKCLSSLGSGIKTLFLPLYVFRVSELKDNEHWCGSVCSMCPKSPPLGTHCLGLVVRRNLLEMNLWVLNEMPKVEKLTFMT